MNIEDYLALLPADIKADYDRLLHLANKTPALLSILYDCDNMPEQINCKTDFVRFVTICALFEKAFIDQPTNPTA